jgi:hypothetical protein
MKTVYERPSNVLTNEVFTTCGGCGHGIVFKLIAEVIEENGWEEKSIIVWPIGCSSFGYKGISLDGINALHGRAPAVATGLKRATDDKIVIVYQGDGDMVSEGLAEIMSAAARSEKISVIFVNNAIFGMTGGQMAATSLENMVTSTSPFGRNPDVAGMLMSKFSTQKLVDAGKHRVLVGVSLLVLLFTMAGYYFMRTAFYLLLAGLLLGVGYGILQPLFQSFVTGTTPAPKRGAANATYLLSYDIGIGIGSFVMGMFHEGIGLSAGFSITAIAYLFGAVIYLLYTDKYYKKLRF